MKPFIIFLWKEALHIIRDKRTLLILLGMPIVQVLLFGFAITNEINNARIAILDPTRDEMTQQLTQRLLSSGYFQLAVRAEREEDILRSFRRGEIKMAVLFSPNFAERFHHNRPAQIQLIADASDPNTATTLVNYASAIIRDFQQESLDAGALPLEIVAETRMMYNPEMKGVFLFVPGIVTILVMLISAMMTSLAITREKENGTMEVLLVSPLHPALIVVGKVVPYILLSGVITAIILAMGVFVFEVPVRGSLWLLAGESLLFVLTALALGIFFSTLTNSQMVAMMMSMLGLMLPTILLSGFIFPIESMPRPLQVVSNAIPAKWFLIIIRGVMLKANTLAELWRETAVLGGMALLFIGLSVRNFKIRLDG
jgi:ABC-2 type transport system permease protein